MRALTSMARLEMLKKACDKPAAILLAALLLRLRIAYLGSVNHKVAPKGVV